METGSMVEKRDESPQQADEREALRAQLHAMWGSVASAWGEHAAYADERGAEVTARMLDLATVGEGSRVLDLACGPGGAGLAAARRAGPQSEIVLSDVSAEMTAIAASRAEELGLGNVETKVLDIERIEEPDSSFDAVICREGLMLVPDPAVGAREIRRVLRPGGRVALAVWGPRERNPWLGLVMDTVSAQLGRPIPPPGLPEPFSLDDAKRLADVLTEGGLADVEVEEIPVPLRVGSVDEWWNRATALAGPLAKMVAAMPEEVAEKLRARARDAAAPYETDEGSLDFPGVTLVASGRRER